MTTSRRAYFDARAFVRITAHQLRRARGSAPLALAAWQVASLPLNHLFLAIDEWCHPEILAVPVEAPVFILGNPRSGTTLLLRLLAADASSACHETYELAIPSSTLRRVLPEAFRRWAARVIDRRFEAWRDIHPVALGRPEEDELLFMLLGNCGLYQLLFPHGPELDDLALARFWEWPIAKRDRFMAFLHGCIQRLLWERRVRRYVGKSPHFSGKIDDLLRWYPDARLIYCIRSPLEAVPSALSMCRAMWERSLGGRAVPKSSVEAMYRTLVGLYAHACERLERVPPANLVIQRYDRLNARPAMAVREIYERFGFPVTREFDGHLRACERAQAHHRSRHRYGLEEFGLTVARVRRDLAFVFERWDLDGYRNSDPGGSTKALAAEP